MRSLGPKTIVLNCPALLINFTHKGQKRETVQVNTAPKAGQRWEISSATFSFPEAIKNTFAALEGLELEFQFKIIMLIGGVEVAEQEILENGRTNAGEESTFHAIGSLEPYLPAIVYAGESLSFTYSIQLNNATTPTLSLGLGKLVINYNLVY